MKSIVTLLKRRQKMTTDTTNDDLPPALTAVTGEGEADTKETTGEGTEGTEAVEAKAAKAGKQAKAAVVKEAAKVDDGRVTIIVDEPNNAPSNQQYFGLNGKGYLITFGEPVRVPKALLNVLNECISTRTIPVEGGGFVERDSLRFPYRVVG